MINVEGTLGISFAYFLFFICKAQFIDRQVYIKKENAEEFYEFHLWI